LLGSHRRRFFKQLCEQETFVYQEAGNYNGAIMITDSNTKESGLAAPMVIETTETQVIL
jgi:hypothetical protein